MKLTIDYSRFDNLGHINTFEEFEKRVRKTAPPEIQEAVIAARRELDTRPGGEQAVRTFAAFDMWHKYMQGMLAGLLATRDGPRFDSCAAFNRVAHAEIRAWKQEFENVLPVVAGIEHLESGARLHLKSLERLDRLIGEAVSCINQAHHPENSLLGKEVRDAEA